MESGPTGVAGSPAPVGPTVPSARAASPGTSVPPGALIPLSMPVSSCLPRRQRQERTVYLKEQQQVLEAAFRKCRYPTQEDRAALAMRLDLQAHKVQVWFKNRRAKFTRQCAQDKGQPQPGRRGCGGRAVPASPGHRAPGPDPDPRSDSDSKVPVFLGVPGCVLVAGPTFFSQRKDRRDPGYYAQENFLDPPVPVLGPYPILAPAAGPCPDSGPAPAPAPTLVWRPFTGASRRM